MAMTRHSKSIHFSVYKSSGNSDMARIELLGLIDHIKRLTKDLTTVKIAIGDAYYQQIEYIPKTVQIKGLIQDTEPAMMLADFEKRSLNAQRRNVDSNRNSLNSGNNFNASQSANRGHSSTGNPSPVPNIPLEQVREINPSLGHNLESSDLHNFEPLQELEPMEPIMETQDQNAKPAPESDQAPEIPNSLPENIRKMYFEKKT